MNVFDKFDEVCRLALEEAIQKVNGLIDIYPKGFENSNISHNDLVKIGNSLIYDREEMDLRDLAIEDKTKIIANSLRVIQYL